ncbi:AAA family ATPase [Candidatus Bathycorpusculum sp.]|uniref:AAA family ATPase n=1 Tax=Candidatus Bathycorpusculum sp. TaxID=2994959 RepID=UPI0028312196|nr:AAA family ATPase [Candidatus Termitimicrobium sp.]MCL2685006.1 AAA family ATPase [Candidatus Termitimicrobium sp.]
MSLQTAIIVVTSAISGVAGTLAIISYFTDKMDFFFIRLRGGVPKGFLVFITGTNGVGKTTVSKKVARKLGIEYINVNHLRETLRAEEHLFQSNYRYSILKSSSYLLPSSEEFKIQCEVMSPAIKQLSIYLQNMGESSVFDGINISPARLLVSGLSAHYILFVNLQVSEDKQGKEKLLERLNSKNIENKVKERNSYLNNIDKIMATRHVIDEDFATVNEKITSNHNIHTKVIDTTNISAEKVAGMIMSEIRKIR